MNALFDEVITEKLAISQIMEILREKPLATGEIAEQLGWSSSEVSKHLNNSARQRLIRFDDDEKRFALA